MAHVLDSNGSHLVQLTVLTDLAPLAHPTGPEKHNSYLSLPNVTIMMITRGSSVEALMHNDQKWSVTVVETHAASDPTMGFNKDPSPAKT